MQLGWGMQVQLQKRTHLDNLGQLNSLLGGALKVIDGEDLHARLVDDLVSGLDVGALKTSNDGDLQVQVLHGLDEAGGDVVAADNTAKDVDKDGSDLGVAGDELKGLLDGSRGSTATNVQEVGGLATVQLDDVHGGHGQTSTVDEAANIAVELDEVQARLGSANLIRVLLCGVAPLEDLLLTEVGVVIETELGIHAENLVVVRLGKGVDLDLGGVTLQEDLVELLDGVLGILDALLAEAKLGSNVAGNLVGNALVDVHVGCDDGLGVLLGDGLNVHTALRRRNDDGGLGSTVHQDSQVELATSKLALANVDRVAKTAASAGLLGDELVANHLVSEHLGFVGRVDDANTTLQAIVEAALSTATGEDLGLDDHVLGANLLGHSLCFLGRLGYRALGNADAILLKRFLSAEIKKNILQLSIRTAGGMSYPSKEVGREVLVDTQSSSLLSDAR